MLSLGAHPFLLPSSSPLHTRPRSRPLCSPTSSAPIASSSSPPPSLRFLRRGCAADRSRRATTMAAVVSPGDGGLVHDLMSSGVTAAIALGLLRFFEELAKRGVCDQKLNRKLVHITIGMVFLLFWPLFSSGRYAPFFAALAPGINIIRMLLLGLGIMKNEAMVKSMSRSGDHRELLKGPLYYATTITLATSVLWRTSPIAIALVCNLCAGDGTCIYLHFALYVLEQTFILRNIICCLSSHCGCKQHAKRFSCFALPGRKQI
uniref:Uncharacterized protein n=2 Tax=Aegilops tauschii subsp. strangulata TaxID=200361 RepID=A0A453FUY1_AEGTS